MLAHSHTKKKSPYRRKMHFQYKNTPRNEGKHFYRREYDQSLCSTRIHFFGKWINKIQLARAAEDGRTDQRAVGYKVKNRVRVGCRAVSPNWCVGWPIRLHLRSSLLHSVFFYCNLFVNCWWLSLRIEVDCVWYRWAETSLVVLTMSPTRQYDGWDGFRLVCGLFINKYQAGSLQRWFLSTLAVLGGLHFAE